MSTPIQHFSQAVRIAGRHFPEGFDDRFLTDVWRSVAGRDAGGASIERLVELIITAADRNDRELQELRELGDMTDCPGTGKDDDDAPDRFPF